MPLRIDATPPWPDVSPTDQQQPLATTLRSVELRPRPSDGFCRRLSLEDSPVSHALQHSIVEGSPPHRALEASPAGSAGGSSPRPAPPAFLQPLAAALQQCVDINEAAAAVATSQATSSASGLVAQRPTPFHGVRPPPIAIAPYMERIAKYAKCSPVCFVMGAVYMERLAEADARLRPSLLNVHRLLVTGVLLAAKLMDDHYFNNAYYAKIGGVALKELNALEVHMMQLLDHRLRVGAPAITQALARIGAAADATPCEFAGMFGWLLPPSAAAVETPAEAGQQRKQRRQQAARQGSGDCRVVPQPVVAPPAPVSIQAC